MEVKPYGLAGGRVLPAETPMGGFMLRIEGSRAAGDYRPEDAILRDNARWQPRFRLPPPTPALHQAHLHGMPLS